MCCFWKGNIHVFISLFLIYWYRKLLTISKWYLTKLCSKYEINFETTSKLIARNILEFSKSILKCVMISTNMFEYIDVPRKDWDFPIRKLPKNQIRDEDIDCDNARIISSIMTWLFPWSSIDSCQRWVTNDRWCEVDLYYQNSHYFSLIRVYFFR